MNQQQMIDAVREAGAELRALIDESAWLTNYVANGYHFKEISDVANPDYQRAQSKADGYRNRANEADRQRVGAEQRFQVAQWELANAYATGAIERHSNYVPAVERQKLRKLEQAIIHTAAPYEIEEFHSLRVSLTKQRIEEMTAKMPEVDAYMQGKLNRDRAALLQRLPISEQTEYA